MKRSILLTVHDREAAVLMGTFRALYRAGLEDDEEVVIVNDRSVQDLAWAQNVAKLSFPHMTWIDLHEYDAYEIDGFRNPARAFNEALAAAKGDDVWVMSSDVIVTPPVLRRARQINTAEMVWTPKIVDIETSAEYCGPQKLFPMPWFLVASRQKCIDIGGWDETYLKGMCFEDNDFVGRLVLHTGAFAGEWSRVAYHQSHNQPAYDIDNPEIRAANDRNREWTLEKWGGIPFNKELTPFDVVREMHISGIPIHRVIEKSGKLARAIALTTGINQKAAA